MMDFVVYDFVWEHVSLYKMLVIARILCNTKRHGIVG